MVPAIWGRWSSSEHVARAIDTLAGAAREDGRRPSRSLRARRRSRQGATLIRLPLSNRSPPDSQREDFEGVPPLKTLASRPTARKNEPGFASI